MTAFREILGRDRPRFVALLRAISNVPMQSFRERMEELGFTDVESYGMSGNLLFSAAGTDTAAPELRNAARLGTAAFVRSMRALATTVSSDPFRSSILFLGRAPTAARRQRFLQTDFDEPRPVLRGKTMFFVYPARLHGKHTPLDCERLLGVRGTARSARVVKALLARMSRKKRR